MILLLKKKYRNSVFLLKKMGKFKIVLRGGFFVSLNINKTFNNEKNLWEVKLMGEVDIYNANNLKENLNNLLQEKETDIELDCEELEYIDSTGLGVLIGILKKLKNIEKNIIISNPKPNMSKLLRITGLDQIFVMK